MCLASAKLLLLWVGFSGLSDSIRAGSLYFSQRNCHGARRVWRTFCRPGTKLIEHYECRGTKLISEANLSNCNKCYKMALAQCRGTSCLGTRILSRCRILIACRCACPGATAIKNLSWVQEQKQKV